MVIVASHAGVGGGVAKEPRIRHAVAVNYAFDAGQAVVLAVSQVSAIPDSGALLIAEASDTSSTRITISTNCALIIICTFYT